MDQRIVQLASQYLTALLEFQCGDDPQLNDPSSPQCYFSSAVCLLNVLNLNPDKRIAAHPNFMNRIVEKLLQPDFETAMRAASARRPVYPPFPRPTFEDDFGSLLQFISTVMIWQDAEGMDKKIQRYFSFQSPGSAPHADGEPGSRSAL